jgi:hypothetical protein
MWFVGTLRLLASPPCTYKTSKLVVDDHASQGLPNRRGRDMLLLVGKLNLKSSIGGQ